MRHHLAIRTIRAIFTVIAALLLFSWNVNVAAADAVGQISIAGNGQTMIKSATVESISGNSLRVSIDWGETRLEWRVETTGATTFYPRMESREVLKLIKPGDIVSISGLLDMAASQPTILASAVRDLSLENNAAAVMGTIRGVDPRSASISVDTESGLLTIAVGAQTVITREGNPIGLSRLEAGEEVTIYGSLNHMTNTLRAVKVASSSKGVDESEEEPDAVTIVPAVPSFFTRLMSWVYGSPGQITIR